MYIESKSIFRKILRIIMVLDGYSFRIYISLVHISSCNDVLDQKTSKCFDICEQFLLDTQQVLLGLIKFYLFQCNLDSELIEACFDNLSWSESYGLWLLILALKKNLDPRTYTYIVKELSSYCTGAIVDPDIIQPVQAVQTHQIDFRFCVLLF